MLPPRPAPSPSASPPRGMDPGWGSAPVEFLTQFSSAKGAHFREPKFSAFPFAKKKNRIGLLALVHYVICHVFRFALLVLAFLVAVRDGRDVTVVWCSWDGCVSSVSVRGGRGVGCLRGKGGGASNGKGTQRTCRGWGRSEHIPTGLSVRTSCKPGFGCGLRPKWGADRF